MGWELIGTVAGTGGSGTQIDATIDAGTTASSTGTITSSSAPFDLGAGGSSLATGPSSVAQSPSPSTQAVTLRAGKTWTNPANATGAPNGTEATISGAATTTAADSFDADLTLSGLSIGDPGGTRTTLALEVTHRYTPASGTGATSSYTIAVLEGTTVLGTLFSIANGGTARAALATDSFNLAAIVGARTPAQISALTYRFRATASLPALLGGSASWAVDGIRLRQTNQLGAPT